MLAIARSLMSRPKLLLMDEPSVGLAPIIVNELAPIIRNIRAKGISVFLIEQNVPLALKAAKRAMLFNSARSSSKVRSERVQKQ